MTSDKYFNKVPLQVSSNIRLVPFTSMEAILVVCSITNSRYFFSYKRENLI